MKEVTAIILCGGKGERLRPLTDKIPKPLVPIRGLPLLVHLLQYLSSYGLKRFVLCVGYKAEIIEKSLQQHQAPDWNLTFLNSGDVSMTDRLKAAQAHISGPALVCYGDTLANVNLAALQKTHQQLNGWATMTVYPLHSSFGVVESDATKRVTQFREKPTLPYWINIGFFYFEPTALARLHHSQDMPDFLQDLTQQKQLFVFEHHGKHLTINTEKERAAAEQEMIEFYTVLDPHHPL